jgi:hypothetical protein
LRIFVGHLCDFACGKGGRWLRVYRINAVGREGRAVVLSTADTSLQALVKLQDALSDYPRAWVTDELEFDISLPDLMRMAEEERRNAQPR